MVLESLIGDWKLDVLIDRGPGYKFRYRTEGVNLNCHPDDIDRTFAWDVPDLDDKRYDLREAAIVRTKAARKADPTGPIQVRVAGQNELVDLDDLIAAQLAAPYCPPKEYCRRRY